MRREICQTKYVGVYGLTLAWKKASKMGIEGPGERTIIMGKIKKMETDKNE